MIQSADIVKRFIEWDALEVRIDGARLNAIALQAVGSDPTIERLQLKFTNGRLRVEGAVRRFITVPFTVDITEMQAQGTTVRVPLGRISAGPIPVPTLVVGLIRDRFPKELVRYEDPATLVLSLDRFLPPFVTADIQKIWIIDGGLAVTLGRGGADIPEGGLNV